VKVDKETDCVRVYDPKSRWCKTCQWWTENRILIHKITGSYQGHRCMNCGSIEIVDKFLLKETV
jgi:hypothetical protein